MKMLKTLTARAPGSPGKAISLNSQGLGVPGVLAVQNHIYFI
jgi:hypothetical protein